MCTSFIYRKDSKIIGMNFDNNGMRFNINTSRPGWFTVDVDEAFLLLAAVSQHSDEWKTDFSMVYAEQNQKVYYCLNSNFNERFEFSLT